MHVRHVPPLLVTMSWSVLMTAVMIGVDPHKGSHTAVAEPLSGRTFLLPLRLG